MARSLNSCGPQEPLQAPLPLTAGACCSVTTSHSCQGESFDELLVQFASCTSAPVRASTLAVRSNSGIEANAEAVALNSCICVRAQVPFKWHKWFVLCHLRHLWREPKQHVDYMYTLQRRCHLRRASSLQRLVVRKGGLNHRFKWQPTPPSAAHF